VVLSLCPSTEGDILKRSLFEARIGVCVGVDVTLRP
jgi:hypothetical protein